MLMPKGALPPVNGPLRPMRITSALPTLTAGVAGAVGAGVFALAGVADAGLAASAAAGGLVCACAKVAAPTLHNRNIDVDISRKKVEEVDGACFMLSPGSCSLAVAILFAWLECGDADRCDFVFIPRTYSMNTHDGHKEPQPILCEI